MSAASPNIVLVSIDSLRADHCGFLGDDRGLTPTMDALADEGVAYERAVAPGQQTFSSMPAVFTGRPRPPTTLERYPQDSHWERRLAAIDEHLGRYALLSERLRERGYDTAGITPNPWTSTASGFDRGFDRFLDYSGTEADSWPRTIVDRVPGIDADTRPVELVLNMLSGSEFFARWETLYEDIQRTREQLSEPYFLWTFILDTHFPFIPGRAHRREQSLLGTYYSAYRSSEPMRGNGGDMPDRVRRSVERSYRDTVRASDAFIDRLQSDLAADDPVLMVHADHGESFGEHGEYGHHHRGVYQENVHVPYFIHNAGVTETVDAPTSLTSIVDTALGIARDGTFDPASEVTPYAIATSESGTNRAVTGRRYKLVEHGDDRLLFDLDRDPDERTDLSRVLPGRCRELRQQLDRFDRHITGTNRLHRATKALASRGNV
jgi:arylsulfatase